MSVTYCSKMNTAARLSAFIPLDINGASRYKTSHCWMAAGSSKPYPHALPRAMLRGLNPDTCTEEVFSLQLPVPDVQKMKVHIKYIAVYCNLN